MDLLVEGGAPDGFAIQLCVPDVGSDKTTGNMWIGGYDSTFVSGLPMMYAKIVEQDFYKVRVKFYFVLFYFIFILFLFYFFIYFSKNILIYYYHLKGSKFFI